MTAGSSGSTRTSPADRRFRKGPSQLLFGGMGRLTENTVLNLKNKSYSVTADIEVPEGDANGVIVAQGGAFGGWSLYLKDGVPTHCYNLLGLNRVKATGTDRSLPGTTRSGWSSPTTATAWPRGRHHAVRGRRPGGHVPPGGEHPHAVLGRRDARRRGGPRNLGQRRLHARHEPSSPAL